MSMSFVQKEGIVIVFASNTVKAGEILLMDDGYYQFWPEPISGYWPTWALRQVADRVDSMNRLWNDKVKALYYEHYDSLPL